MKHYFDSVQENLLLQFLSDKGITLSDDKLEKLYEYANLVIQGNTQVNLISKNDEKVFNSLEAVSKTYSEILAMLPEDLKIK